MPIIGDVFGLNSIYEKQVENIDNNNFESWPESATYGYFGGGFTSTAVSEISVSRHTNLTLPPDSFVNSDNCTPATEPSDPVITEVDKDPENNWNP